MELAEMTLHEYLKQGVLHPPSLHPPSLYQLIWDIISALDFAHHRGIFHADIKPGNILLFRNQGKNSYAYKLSDWGEGKDVSNEIRKTGKGTIESPIHGTASYLAPEVSSNDDILAINFFKADVFSLGVTLFKCVGGDVEDLRKKINKQLESNLKDENQVPEEYNHICRMPRRKSRKPINMMRL